MEGGGRKGLRGSMYPQGGFCQGLDTRRARSLECLHHTGGLEGWDGVGASPCAHRDTCQAIRTFGREKRVPPGGRPSRSECDNQEEAGRCRDALQLLASRSLQMEPSVQWAELVLPSSGPLPTCLREGLSSEHHAWAATHQPTSPHWTVGRSEVPRRGGT